MKAFNTIQMQSNKYLKSYSYTRENIDTVSSTSTAEKSLQIQIAELKKIAHRSFLQVMQAETLHRQEIAVLQQALIQTTRKHQMKENQLLQKIQGLEKELNKCKSNFKQVQAQVFNFASQDLIIQEKNEGQGEMSADFSQFIAALNKNIPEQERQIEQDIFDLINQFLPKNEAQILAQNLLEILDFHTALSMNSFKNLDLKRKNIEIQSKLDNLQLKYQFSVKQLKNLQNHIKSLDSVKIKLQSKNEQLKKKLRSYECDARSRTEKSIYSQSSASQSKFCEVLPTTQNNQNNGMKNLFVSFQQKFKRLKSHSYNYSQPCLRFIRQKTIPDTRAII